MANKMKNSDSDSETTTDLLPTISKNKYEKLYNRFMEWKEKNKARSFSESVMLAYFVKLKNQYKPTTLWCNYSILRSTISLRHSVDISKYSKLRALLKKESKGYQPKKSKTLTQEQINTFIMNAPNDEFLMIKVAFAIGILGGCRRAELCNLTIDDIQDLGQSMLVKIPNPISKIPRTFVLTGNMYALCKKFLSLRPKNVLEKRFFLSYRNGRCTRQVVGINTFGTMPKKVAIYLNLKNPELYTGHSFRRSSATLFRDQLLSDNWSINDDKEKRLEAIEQGKVATQNLQEPPTIVKKVLPKIEDVKEEIVYEEHPLHESLPGTSADCTFSIKEEPVENIKQECSFNDDSIDEEVVIKKPTSEEKPVEDLDLDPIDLMFLDFSKKFKTFSSKRQLHVKTRFYQIMSEAEMEEIRESKSSVQSFV